MKKALIFVFASTIFILMTVLYIPINHNQYKSENDELSMKANLNTYIIDSEDAYYLTVLIKNKTNKPIRISAGNCLKPIRFVVDNGFSWEYFPRNQGCMTSVNANIILEPNETRKEKIVIQRNENNPKKVGTIIVSAHTVENIAIQLK